MGLCYSKEILTIIEDPYILKIECDLLDDEKPTLIYDLLKEYNYVLE